MGTLNFNTSNDTFRQIMGNGVTYVVPPFQRDYSWSEENWDELWQDILALFADDPEPGHYMGYLVLQTQDNRKFCVVDGQQRLTTLSIMILAALKHLGSLAQQGMDSENNTRRVEQIRNTYIGYVNPVTLVAVSKLNLNRNNNAFYQNYLASLPEHIPQRSLNTSETLLRKAFFWFVQKMAEKFAHTSTSGQELAQFLDSLVDKLFFTVIRVTDELNAFKVFETLNARGVRLSSTDLLKNWFFSLVSANEPHEHEIRTLEDFWTHILWQLGSDETFPEFLRVFWNSRHKLVRKADLFKTVRRTITTNEQVFDQLRALDYSAGVYEALRDPLDSSFWKREEQEYLQALKLFGVRQPLPLLLAAYETFHEHKRECFTAILRCMAVTSLRYNVICNQPPNEQEMLYNDIATGIVDGKLKNSSEVKKELLRLYPGDSLFRESFANKVFNTSSGRNKNIVRHLLARIGRHMHGAPLDATDTTVGIEHILPESPDASWAHMDERKQEELRYRLGNMMLLENSLNRDVGNADFTTKKLAYARSACPDAKSIASSYDIWDENAIVKRQSQLAKAACAVWRID